MSVSGLEAADVVNAYQTALKNTDQGAWFFLQYISRDELGFREQGIGGFDQLKAAVAAFSEVSPLYGLFYHRDRKLLFKYIPAGTSRLLQVRTAVHFQTIIDRFSPTDATLAFTNLDELTEDVLQGKQPVSSENAANKPSPLQSSRNSVEQEQLVESSHPEVSNILSRLRAIREGRPGLPVPEAEKATVATVVPGAPEAATTSDLSRTLPDVPSLSRCNSISNISHTTEFLRDEIEMLEKELADHEWQEPKESNEYTYQTWKPKVKPFPRPATDDRAKKVQAATSIRQRLPSGLRVGLRKPRVTSSDVQNSNNSSLTPEKSRPSETRTQKDSQTQTPPSRKVTERPVQVQLQVQSSPVPAQSSPVESRVSSRYGRIGEGSLRANSVALSSQDNTEAMGPLTLERQRLMQAVSLRNRRLGLSTDSQATSQYSLDHDVEHGTHSERQHSNADSGVDVECGDDSASDAELSTLTNLRLRRRRAHAGKIEPRASASWITAAEDDIHIPTQRFSRSIAIPSIGSYTRPVAGFEKPWTARTRLESASAANLNTHYSSTKRNTTSSKDFRADETGYDSSSSSDSLFDELQGAILQQARRISIGTSHGIKTGVTTDGTPSPYSITSVIIRTGSNHSRTTSAANSTSTGNAGTKSAAVPEQSQIARKAYYSSGLSKRVQALNEIAQGGKQELEICPESSSIPSSRRTSAQYHDQSTLEVSRTRAAGSVSVTAHITKPDYFNSTVRGSNHFGTSTDLRRSSIIVEHHNPDERHVQAQDQIRRPVSMNPLNLASNRVSSASSKRRSMDSGMMYLGRVPSEQRHANPLGSSRSSMNLSGSGEGLESKRETRAARMMKRFSSNFSTSSRQPLVDVSEQPIVGSGHESFGYMRYRSTIAMPSAIGELNVQFPDTLLWKRRWVEVDASGNFILGAIKVNERSNTVPKKYHVSEFRAPAIPSHDRQELPYSILMDFINGGTLQLACDDLECRAQVLDWLTSIYNRCVS